MFGFDILTRYLYPVLPLYRIRLEYFDQNEVLLSIKIRRISLINSGNSFKFCVPNPHNLALPSTHFMLSWEIFKLECDSDNATYEYIKFVKSDNFKSLPAPKFILYSTPPLLWDTSFYTFSLLNLQQNKNPIVVLKSSSSGSHFL